MRKRIILFLSYYLFWVVFFIINKFQFLFYHTDKSFELPVSDWFKILAYGLRMDLAMAGYMLLIPGLLLVVSSFLKQEKWLRYFFNVYSIFFLILAGFLVATDMELYRHWGYRLDATPVLYVKTNPGGAMALGDNWVLIRQVLYAIITAIIGIIGYRQLIMKKLLPVGSANWKVGVYMFFITGALILPIRSTLGMTPLNSGFVYFHNTNMFANHSALNLLWNVGYSLTNKDKETNPTDFFDQGLTKLAYNQLFRRSDSTVNILKTDRPNVILIILENYTSKFIEPLGGKSGVSPNIEKLIKEGVVFDHFYASGDRTEKGVVAVLNAYPAHPTVSIIKFPKKTQNMGFLNKTLEKEGYSTGFISGYDLTYANFRSYFNNAQFDHITSAEDFEVEPGKWGIHDHFVFNRMLDDIDNLKEPFFQVGITLSSHQPFDVPMETVIEGEDESSRFMNSAYYTDKSLGEFIEKAQSKVWWDNTLLLITADHGNIMPYGVFNGPDNVFKIPFIMSGPALAKQDTVIHTFGTQNDIANTLLGQLNIQSDDFKFSRDLLAPDVKSFAFFDYNNGFGYINDSTLLIYDNVGQQYLGNPKPSSQLDQMRGKAVLQMIYNDMNDL